MNPATIDLAISVLLSLINKSAEISAIISKMKAENRTDLTADELKSILSKDDAARDALVAEITKARVEGR